MCLCLYVFVKCSECCNQLYALLSSVLFRDPATEIVDLHSFNSPPIIMQHQPIHHSLHMEQPLVNWVAWAGPLNQLSLLPFLAFLWTLWRLPTAPKKAVQGWTFYLVFIAVAIPAGIYCRSQLGTSMANVDWVHGEERKIAILCV